MRFQRMNNKLSEKQEFDESNGDFENEDPNFGDCPDMLTLEGLRRTLNSCSNCGVSWIDSHVSLDCSECGGYAMLRPCPTCNGQCGSLWKRDAKASHVNKHAQWNGACSLSCQSQNLLQTMSENQSPNFPDSYHRLSQNLMREAQIL